MKLHQRVESQDASSKEQEAEEEIDREQRPRNRQGNCLQERAPMKLRRQERVVSAHRTRKKRADGERYGCCEFRSHAAPPHGDWFPDARNVLSGTSFEPTDSEAELVTSEGSCPDGRVAYS